MVFATLILAVAILLSAQMVCSTWRDVNEERCRTMLELKDQDLYQP